MAYGAIHITNGNSSDKPIRDHGDKIREALKKLGDKAEIYSVQHSLAGQYGQYVSTLILYREYED